MTLLSPSIQKTNAGHSSATRPSSPTASRNPHHRRQGHGEGFWHWDAQSHSHHDKLDFEIGERHNLPIIDCLNPDGTLNPETAGEEFGGMDRFEARKATVKKLEEQGDLIETEEHENNVGFSERADVPIEPRLSDQWFLKYPRIEEAKQAVRNEIIKFHPQRWVKPTSTGSTTSRTGVSSPTLVGAPDPVWHKR